MAAAEGLLRSQGEVQDEGH
ncbi:hypothetical protein HaLaN_13278, partial [Haematococcus lacustris]